MKTTPLAARTTRPFLAILALAALCSARAQTAPAQLDPFVTTATRTPATPQTLGSAVDTISASDLAREQIGSLAAALGSVPGAPVLAAGARGAAASLFLRGANSNQTLFLVDGIRLNDPNTDYAVFLGGACASACDNLEVAHGPQSTLYGGEAVGGVVSLRAERGAGAPSARVAVEAGSFGTVQGALAAQGASGANAWNFSAAGGHTDNARANNSFDSTNVALRLDRQLGERASVGGTLRWFRGDYGDPGDRFTNDPDNRDREDNVLATAFGDFKLADAWRAHVVLGGQDRRFVSENPRAGGATQITLVKNRRGILDAQTTYAGIERHRITAGLTAEANRTRNTGFGDIDRAQRLVAVFAQDEFSPRDDVFLTAGVRNDDFDTFGRATTGRATAAWLVAQRALKLRASYGTGFSSPTLLDLYGTSAFYRGNPNLRPERARGWDAGVDYYLASRRGTVSATWFDTEFSDLIVFDFGVFPGTTKNVERARTRGLELATHLTLAGGFSVRASYTYLEAENLSQHNRLLRRPRHSGNLDLWHDFGGGVSAGAGVAFAAQREDIDARTFATIDAEDYTVARLYAAWQATPRLALKARIENLLDESYEDVNGYPALGLGAFAGAEWKF
ncbi:MAG TPA: TonB-dependent receptor [Opitutaceae bacterium]|nr:TonB-dependent receptor [Opitutaceae bacterium]